MGSGDFATGNRVAYIAQHDCWFTRSHEAGDCGDQARLATTRVHNQSRVTVEEEDEAEDEEENGADEGNEEDEEKEEGDNKCCSRSDELPSFDPGVTSGNEAQNAVQGMTSVYLSAPV